jgi:3-hydroxyacyl-[acyl-carrier-protein] dehydratase
MRFIMIDRVLEIVPGKTIRAVKVLLSGEELFGDHFPGFPVVPGVLLAEMMAQAAGRCLYAATPERGLPVLAQIKTASFREWVRPDEQVLLFAEIKSAQPRFATALCHAQVRDRKVASAELLFSYLPLSQIPAGDPLRILAPLTTDTTPGSPPGTAKPQGRD